MILIDSNIWNYYFDKTCKEHKFVVPCLEKFSEKEVIVVNTAIVMEVAHYLIKKLGPEIGREKINTFLELPLRMIDLDYGQMKDAIGLLCRYSHVGIGGRDATLLATMKKTRTKKMITHDKAFKKVDWIKVIDPIPFE